MTPAALIKIHLRFINLGHKVQLPQSHTQHRPCTVLALSRYCQIFIYSEREDKTGKENEDASTEDIMIYSIYTHILYIKNIFILPA